MHIYLVRHGQKRKDQDRFSRGFFDPDLTRLGMQQAHQTGQRLKGLPMQAIFTSDLARTRQTAEIINQYIARPLQTRPDLREICMGDWEGVSFETLAEREDAYYLAWRQHTQDLPYPNGESGADVLVRITSFLDELCQQNLEDVLLVTHGGLIRVLVSASLLLGMEKRFHIPVSNCSLSILEMSCSSHEIKLVCLNDTAHLTPFEVEKDSRELDAD
jgi:broad specificity phosphatase PhoE